MSIAPVVVHSNMVYSVPMRTTTLADRDREIVALAVAGVPYSKIGPIYGLTLGRAQQIAKAAGVSRNPLKGVHRPKTRRTEAQIQELTLLRLADQVENGHRTLGFAGRGTPEQRAQIRATLAAWLREKARVPA